jgi:adenine phosphoribosyltransferase
MYLSEIEKIKNSIRNIPDFPVQGIQFKDITTAIKDPLLFNYITDILAERYMNKGITKVVAIESRGFIIAGALAYKLHAGFVPVRKPRKLPYDTYSVTYDLEYGQDSLHMHQDALDKDDIVLVHDDLLATGGTALATLNLVKLFHVKKSYISFIVELDCLNGRSRLEPTYDVYSLVHFDD